jgi:hypothetical protein
MFDAHRKWLKTRGFQRISRIITLEFCLQSLMVIPTGMDYFFTKITPFATQKACFYVVAQKCGTFVAI